MTRARGRTLLASLRAPVSPWQQVLAVWAEARRLEVAWPLQRSPDGLPLAAIAAALDVPASTLHRRLRIARRLRPEALAAVGVLRPPGEGLADADASTLDALEFAQLVRIARLPSTEAQADQLAVELGRAAHRAVRGARARAARRAGFQLNITRDLESVPARKAAHHLAQLAAALHALGHGVTALSPEQAAQIGADLQPIAALLRARAEDPR